MKTYGIMELSKNYNAHEAEPKWQEFWEKEGVYKFQQGSNAEVYSVDTPPPTVSGKMHLGHSFSYSQQDFMVRFHRMLGKNVFYPFGTDDNGLASERLVEKIKNVKSKDMSRDEFVALCLETLDSIRQTYVNDMKRLGISCDWSIFYSTIDKHCQKISQKSFIYLYKKGREYRKDAPTMWCPECQTGISQVECQDKILDSFFNDVIFRIGEENLIIATTRPELLPACVAIFYHPDDIRYQKYNGKKAKVPLFNFEVPILPDERADPEKGTGIVMCCTFGDQTDMEWQKAHSLPIKIAISIDGRMTELAEKYRGLRISAARKEIINDLKEAGLLVKQEPIKHAVNVHERCGTEIEFLKSRQWFIKYLDLKEDMLEWGRKLNWYPEHMRHRYDNWIRGLQWDWLISRQRYFGVPFPVWYCKKCEEVVLADESQLPLDPLRSKPKISKCPKCGCAEFIPEKDVLDTWATSSLTPQLSTELMGQEIQKKIYPMSLRPQAHDIITFWLFNTVVKSQLHNGVNPWKDVAISGHSLDPHGKKMSKSKGNVIEPQEVVKKYSADCLRFWAAGSKLGDDLPYQEKDIVTGQKFTTKLWNASKFSFIHLEGYSPKKVELEMMDKWILSKLTNLVHGCTESFMKYEYSRTKAETENFFWHTFCDNYLEIVKDRLYNPDKRGAVQKASAQFGLYTSLLTILKLMAPIMPYITEEVYQGFFMENEKEKSIHISKWPDINMADEEAEKIGDFAIYVISKVRKVKADNKLSLKTPIKQISSRGKISLEGFERVKDDIISVTGAQKISFEQLGHDSSVDYEAEIEL